MRRGGVYVVITVVLSILGTALIPIFSVQAKTRVEVNIFHPGAAYNTGLVTSLQQTLGIQFTSTKWYQDWATAFDPSIANAMHAAGFIPELTWEPQLNGIGVSYNDVVSGSYDSYINQTALAVKSLNHTIRISLAPEMNTDWTPWGIGKQGNTADNHKLFWRHVVTKFRDAGVTNVKWIWSANVRPWNASALYGSYANIFPGSEYVDYLGLDGYNWGASQSWSVWQTFREVFESSYNELVGVANKDVLIMEIASTEVGGSKAQWISDMFSTLESSFPRIKGFTWFNINKETDWRITSSESATASFVAGYKGQSSTTATNSSTQSTTNKPSSTPQTKPANNSANQVQSTPEPVADPALEVPAEEIPKPLPKKTAGSLVATQTTANDAKIPLANLAIILAIIANGLVLASLFANRLYHLSLKKKFFLIGLGLVDSVYSAQQLRHRQESFYRKIRGV